MNDADVQDFVTRFAAAWAARDGEAFLALWHPDGVLQSPLYDRPVAGKEFGRLTALVREKMEPRALPSHPIRAREIVVPQA
jgi:ketosteroid isomerase-like protein